MYSPPRGSPLRFHFVDLSPPSTTFPLLSLDCFSRPAFPNVPPGRRALCELAAWQIL